MLVGFRASEFRTNELSQEPPRNIKEVGECVGIKFGSGQSIYVFLLSDERVMNLFIYQKLLDISAHV